jgi:16S rRNA (guanine(966)-N(2))-methyltransferase RsmD
LKLAAPAGATTRPTADRVKEALFSILESAGVVHNAQVLDLFAGSGALGIEALSRGAAHVTMVDRSRPALEALRKNLQHTKLMHRATILERDGFKALDLLVRQQARFDLILIDPPYNLGLQSMVLERIATILAPTGLAVAESAARELLPERVGSCRRTDRRVYGDTALAFYVLERNNAP